MSDTNIGTTEDTGTSATDATTQAPKTFTQDEVNALMARTKSQLEKKFTSKYEDLGDPEQIREVLSQHNKREQEAALKRGEFDKIIQEMASRKDAEIQKRDKVIESFKLETPVIDAAARYRAVNPEQVKALVRNNLRLSSDGEVEVLDREGKVRYDDSGRLLTVDSYVQNWLQENPHFVQATPSTTSTRSNVNSAGAGKVDISKLDMKNPEHRKQYAEYRKSAGIA